MALIGYVIGGYNILTAFSGNSDLGNNNANFPNGTDWMCSHDECAHTFNLSMNALGKHHKNNYGQSITCPKCSKTPSVRVDRCSVCKNYFPQQREAFKCPHCAEKAEQKDR